MSIVLWFSGTVDPITHISDARASVALNFTSEEPEMSRKLDPERESGELTLSRKPRNRRKELASHCPKVRNLTDRGSSFHFYH